MELVGNLLEVKTVLAFTDLSDNNLDDCFITDNEVFMVRDTPTQFAITITQVNAFNLLRVKASGKAVVNTDIKNNLAYNLYFE